MLKQGECCRAEQPPPSPRNQRCHRLSVHSEYPKKNAINPKHTSEEQAQRRLLLVGSEDPTSLLITGAA